MLVIGCVAVGHALLGLDWRTDMAWIAVGVLGGSALGVYGCALTLASELGRRQYRLANPEPPA